MKSARMKYTEQRRLSIKTCNRLRLIPKAIKPYICNYGTYYIDLKPVKTLEDLIEFLDKFPELQYSFYAVDTNSIVLTYEHGGLKYDIRCSDKHRVIEEYLNIECEEVTVTPEPYTMLQCKLGG